MQGACYYGVFWGTRPGSPYKQNTCCPALLLEVVSLQLCIDCKVFNLCHCLHAVSSRFGVLQGGRRFCV